MRVSEKALGEALGLARSTLRVRRARGRLKARGVIELPTEANGVRRHAALDPRDVAASGGVERHLVKHGIGLFAVQNERGHWRRASLQERTEYAAANSGRCMCEACVALADAPRLRADLEAARVRSSDPIECALRGEGHPLLQRLAAEALRVRVPRPALAPAEPEDAEPLDTDAEPVRRRERVL
jgi:hypothetical protein